MLNLLSKLFNLKPKQPEQTEPTEKLTLSQEMLKLSQEAKRRKEQECRDKEKLRLAQIKQFRQNSTITMNHLLQLIKDHASAGEDHMHLPKEQLEDLAEDLIYFINSIVGRPTDEEVDMVSVAITEELENLGFQIDLNNVPDYCAFTIRWLPYIYPKPHYDRDNGEP